MAFPKISKAKDGLREAHMDVLVAVFGKAISALRTPSLRYEGPEANSKKPAAETTASRYPKLPDKSG